MRLLTRADFDGLACAAILKELGVVDCWKFVHPKDMQDGIVDVDENDVIANIPYAPGCKLWFDHHSSETERLDSVIEVEGASYRAPSCARIVYEYYGGKEQMPQLEEMVQAVDKVDAGRLSRDEINDPEGWILLGFIMDPRTGLGRHSGFTIGNYALMEMLIDACRTMKIGDILALPDVVERVDFYWEQNELYKNMILQYSRIDWEIIVTDLRGVENIYTGNRFLMYSLYPDQNISIWLMDGRERQNCVFAVGYSIINRTATVDVGKLMLKYGGGGHHMVGTCQIPYKDSDRVLSEIVGAIHAATEAEKSEIPFINTNELDELLTELDLPH